MIKPVFVKKRAIDYFDLSYEDRLISIREAVASLQSLVFYLKNAGLGKSERAILSEYLGLKDSDFASLSGDKISNYLRISTDLSCNYITFNYADNFFFNSINRGLDISQCPKWTAQLRICRGITFNNDTGELVSFPPEKMFNVGEYEDGKISRFAKKFVEVPSQISEKIDGILIQAFYDKNSDEVLFGTRSVLDQDGNSYIDTARSLAKRTGRFSMLKDLLKDNKSVAFELIDPNHRVVIGYGKKSALVLHHVRDLKTLKTLDYKEMQVLAKKLGFLSPKIEKFDSFEEILDSRKSLRKDLEGYVVRFEDGSAIKVKTNSYFEKLKGLRNLSYSAIAESILNRDDWNIFLYDKIKSEELFDAANHYRARIVEQSGLFDDFLKEFCEKIVSFSGWESYGSIEKLEAMTEFNYAYLDAVKRSLIDSDKLSRDDFRIAINHLIRVFMGETKYIDSYNKKLMDITVKALKTSAWMGEKLEELNRSYTAASLTKDIGSMGGPTSGGLGSVVSDKGAVYEMDPKEKAKRKKQAEE